MSFSSRLAAAAHRLKVNPHIQLKARALPYLVGLVLLMQVIDTSKIWTALLVGLGGIWLIGYLWTRSLSQNLQLKREMRFGWAQVGDRLEERFTITNHGWIPALWIEVEDHSEIPGYKASRVSAVDGKADNQWRHQGVCTQRGLFTLGPTSLHSGDPLGIYQLSIHDPASATLMVTPPVVPLPEIGVAPGGRTGEGRPRADAPERTVSAAGVREYAPGDNLRWVHWATTARRDDLYVRIFEGTPAGDWWIFLDLEHKVQAGEGWDSTQEHGVILAASLADRGLRSGEAVGLAVNGRELVWLPPRKGDLHRWEILRALALVEAGEISMAELFGRNQSAIGGRSSLVVITPNPGPNWIETLIPLRWRGAVPTVLLLDPVSYGVPRNIASTQRMLRQSGISHHVISSDFLDRPEARPGKEGQWEFRVTASGKALPVRKPGNLRWKPLS